MALSFGTCNKFLLGHIKFSAISKVIRGLSSLVLPSLPSLGFYFIACGFQWIDFCPKLVLLCVY